MLQRVHKRALYVDTGFLFMFQSNIHCFFLDSIMFLGSAGDDNLEDLIGG